MGVTALISLLTGETVQAEQTIFFIALGFEGIILSFAAFFSFQKFLNKQAAEQDFVLSIPKVQIAICVLGAGIAILVGSQINAVETINWLFLPVLNILAVVLPLWALLGFGTRRLPLGSRWQVWNVIGLGMTLGPLILIILEVVVVIIAFVGIIIYIVTQPELALEIQRFSQKMMTLDPNSEAALNLIAPYLNRPVVLFSALSYFAIIVPAIEEIFKPIGVWIFIRKLESSAQGFAFGALSGASFALVETFGVSGQTGEWAGLLTSRIGTGILHITTSALMGAAITLAWRERRYFRLIGTYLLVITLHGFWNALAITYSFSTLADVVGQNSTLTTLQGPITIGMGFLAIVMFAILVISNRKIIPSIRVFSGPPPHPQ